MALASGGIFGCPLSIAKVTAPKIMVDIPSAVRGVDWRTKNERVLNNMPLAVKVVASVLYVIWYGMAFALQRFIESLDFFVVWTVKV